MIKVYFAIYLVLIDKGNVLLSKRKNTGYQDGNFGLVAGHVEEGETAFDCIIRESFEEANININEHSLRVVKILHRIAKDRTYIDVFITANEYTGIIINKEPDRCDGLIWCPVNSLPKNLVPEVKFVLCDVDDGKFYNTFKCEGVK